MEEETDGGSEFGVCDLIDVTADVSGQTALDGESKSFFAQFRECGHERGSAREDEASGYGIAVS